MDHTYTEMINDKYLDLTDKDIYIIRNKIENTPDDTNAKEWKKIITNIAKEYCYSSRYFLLRFLGYKDSMEDAMNLSENAMSKYREKLESLVIDRVGKISDSDHALIVKSLADKKKNVLPDRDEAFRLGHLLGFDLMTMQKYLMRVLENDDGINFKMSNDLIEAYGFLTNAGCSDVLELKAAYESCTHTVEKSTDDSCSSDFTSERESSLIEKVENWKHEYDADFSNAAGSHFDRQDMDSQFINWISDQAPYLDIPSRTALRVYRNLAAFVFDIIQGHRELPAEAELLDEIVSIIGSENYSPRTRSLFFDENGSISKEKCQYVTNIFGDYHIWHDLHTNKDGKPQSEIQNARVAYLLAMNSDFSDVSSPQAYIQKSDILYMLWFIENMCWHIGTENDPDHIFNQLADMIDIANECLAAAMLPEFYPPHLLEQTLMLSIIGLQDDNTPDAVYEEICKAVNGTKNKEKGVKHKDKAEKGQIICKLLTSNVEIKTLSEQSGVNEKTLYAWRDDVIVRLLKSDDKGLQKKYAVSTADLGNGKSEIIGYLAAKDFESFHHDYGVSQKKYKQFLEIYQEMNT